MTTNGLLIEAAVTIGIPYAHYAMVRSDVSHLCQAAHPTILSIFAYYSLKDEHRTKIVSFALIAILGVLTLLVPTLKQPGVYRLLRSHQFIERTVCGNQLWINAGQAQVIDTVEALIQDSNTRGRIFLAPAYPGLYRILESRSPVWDNYPMMPRGLDAQRLMIASLESQSVLWAVIEKRRISGLGFKETHPLVWDYLHARFSLVESSSFPDSILLFRRKATSTMQGQEFPKETDLAEGGFGN